MRRACAGLVGLSVMVGLLSLSACKKKEWEFGDDIPTKVEEPGKEEPVAIDHFVKISTTKGDMWAELFPDVAPKTVENFLKLIDMKYYDGLTFHRIVRDFMIQGGDDKKGGPGWTIKRELSDVKHCRGTLSMARTQEPDSANAQFFIVHRYSDSSKALDNQYATFGRVIRGLKVIDDIVAAADGFPGAEKFPPADKCEKINSITRVSWDEIQKVLPDAKKEWEAETDEAVQGDPTYKKVPYWTPGPDEAVPTAKGAAATPGSPSEAGTSKKP